MNMMRDLTSVVLASEQVSLGSVDDARDMVREADNPELQACYDRIGELEVLLNKSLDFLVSNAATPRAMKLADDIYDTLNPHLVAQ